MNRGILHLSRHGHGSWLLILFGLFSLMTVIGFVTATPITAAAFVAWGPILLALAIRSQSTFALEKDRHPPEQVGCLTTRSPTLVSGSAPIIGCEASAGQAAPPRGLQGGDCLVTAMGPARRKQGAQREDTTP